MHGQRTVPSQIWQQHNAPTVRTKAGYGVSPAQARRDNTGTTQTSKAFTRLT